MPGTQTSPSSEDSLLEQTQAIFDVDQRGVCERTDKLLGQLMIFQWVATIFTALWISPRTWAGVISDVHIHVWAALILGGVITFFPVYLAFSQPGKFITRHVIAGGQMLMAALLIHLTGGRIETHFLIFGSLAFLAFYRDWRVLITASLVTAIDHAVRGLLWPQSIYGILTIQPWRWLEHTGWVIFEDIFLIVSIRKSLKAAWDVASRQSSLERTNEIIEAKVAQRTTELQNEINERKEAELKFRDLLESAPDALVIVSEDGHISMVNAQTEKIFGYTKEELIGQSVELLIPAQSKNPEHPDSFFSELQAKSKGNSLELQALRKDSTELSVDVSLSPLKTGEWISAFRDITIRKDTERRVSEFYSMVSHELRTPITSIRGTLSLMEGGRLGPLSERAQRLAHIARNESERLIRLINNILDIRKIEADKLRLKFEELPPHEIVDSALRSLESMAAESSIKLVSEINTTDRIFCDRDRILQVLTNLISNAIKFSPNHAAVILRVETIAQEIIRFSVIDKGPGIPKEQIPKLFRLFQQLDSSDSRPKGGTGLGLAISKGIIEQHLGNIGLGSTVGQGSTFWFELPQKKGIVVSKTSALPYKILLVEDDHNLCEMLRDMLADDGFGVDEVSSIKEAEQYLANQPKPDIVILDVQLPDGNGLELFDKLSQKAKTDNVPVVVITGRDPELGTYGHPLLIDWITKPFDETRLLRALKSAIGSRVPGRARVLVLDDDEPTRNIIKQELELLNVECFEAADGASAIHIALTKDPDLIILDLAMPPPDGFQVVEILRKEKLKNTPLLVYTARDLSENDKEMLTLGLTEHLVKSRTSEEQFVETVKSLLNGLVPEQEKYVEHPLSI